MNSTSGCSPAKRSGWIRPGCFRWLEVEGPIRGEDSAAGIRLLFGDLPIQRGGPQGSSIEVVSRQPREDANRLLRAFLKATYRRPDAEREARRFLPVVESALKSGSPFAEALLAGYTAILCSPEFLCIRERPGRLDGPALATRLSFFLWNSVPDAELREVAEKGRLLKPEGLRTQTDRLLDHPNSRRFVEAFLDYWLDLRRIQTTAPNSSGKTFRRPIWSTPTSSGSTNAWPATTTCRRSRGSTFATFPFPREASGAD